MSSVSFWWCGFVCHKNLDRVVPEKSLFAPILDVIVNQRLRDFLKEIVIILGARIGI